MTMLTTVRHQLAQIPELAAEAHHYRTPGNPPDARHAGFTFKAPIVPDVFDLLDGREKDVEEPEDNRLNGERRTGVLPSLRVWVAYMYPELDELGHAPQICCAGRTHTVAGECSWLSDHAHLILELHPNFAIDIAKLHRELQRACRIRSEYIPTCPACATMARRWRVEPVYPADSMAPAYYRCTGCGQTFNHHAEIQRLALTQPRMTIRQISSMLGIAVRTLYNWRTEGRFMTDSKGRADVEHVKRAAQRVGV